MNATTHSNGPQIPGVPTAQPVTPAVPPPLPAKPSEEEPTVWPRSAQAAAAVLVLIALLLVAIHAYLSGRWATRPSKIQSRQTRSANPVPVRGGEENAVEPAAMAPPRKAESRVQTRIVTAGKTPKLAEGDRKIDLNRASVQELQKLPGIGPVMSQRIVDRRQVEPFHQVDDLRKVPGIGAKTLEKLKPLVRVTTPLVAETAQ